MRVCNIIWTVLVGTCISRVKSAERCCSNNVIAEHFICGDGTKLLPKCTSFHVIFVNNGDLYFRYILRNDTQGEYLDAYALRFIVRSPNFCVGKQINEPDVEIVAVCFTERIPYDEMNTEIDESDNLDFYFMSYWVLFDDFINLLSCLLLAVAFYIYYLVIQTRQIEDDCLLNVAGSLCLHHATVLYDYFSSIEVVPDFCITRLYMMNLFSLSGFAWYALFMYYLWKKSRSAVSLEHKHVMKQLRYIGYGAPAILIIFANIHAHARNLYLKKELELECYAHEELLEDMYVYIPIIFAVGTNCYFWRQLRNVGTTAVKTTQDEFNQKTTSSLLTLNRRLFFAFGLPWLLNIFFNKVTKFVYSSSITYSWFFADTVTNGTGIFVALILVMSRARVWRCVIHKYENFKWLQKWQPSDEISVHTDSDSINHSKTQPSEV